MLEELQLEINRPGAKAKVRKINAEDRGAADIGTDQALGLRDALARDGIVCGQGGALLSVLTFISNLAN
jgi:hypothetical protein